MGLQPGAVFNEFTIERLLGSGGMGTVYLAKHPRLRRRVALKVLTDTFTLDPKARFAFDREANLAAGLDHPNIVPVYDRNAADDPDLWLAMRYVGGGDAAALLSEHPDGLAPERGVRLIDGAARALDYAHDQGVLHRDVKPANLLIETDHRHNERAVLTDFGIARTLDDTVTMSGIAASFAYAAPERFTDSPADRRADIYSLGCTLYQLLTGRPPFPRKDQAAVIGAHLTAPPPAPRALRPELPVELDAVIATALAKSPQDRYATCTALAEAATRCLTPAAVTVRWESPRSLAFSTDPTPQQPAAAPMPQPPVATPTHHAPTGTPTPQPPAADPTPRQTVGDPTPSSSAPDRASAQPDAAPASPQPDASSASPRPVTDRALAVPTLPRPVGKSTPRPSTAGQPAGDATPPPPTTAPSPPHPDHAPEPPPPTEPGTSDDRSPRARRLATAAGSGVLVAAIGVAGVLYAMRDNPTTPATTPTSSPVSQQVTPTTTPAPSATQAVPTPPTVETSLVTADSPTEQAQPTAPAVQQHTYTPEAPQVLPHSKTY
ncbi:protein kinase [Nocardia sp. CA2R105]|uniref:serine/threonine-protein kinase n=1 Tax=Nocardia coffeae TaxID=2873381 RepID=UPI001CA61E82|nr:serine/threonine-protein kinase [Nocardia coffeae]MBY8855667.1 protein kinase [Nocardia coffeae]